MLYMYILINNTEQYMHLLWLLLLNAFVCYGFTNFKYL